MIMAKLYMNTPYLGLLLLAFVSISQSQTIWQCNFDTGSTNPCGMTQSSTDNFDWIPFNKSTPSANTGPSADHTSGTGYFMYIEATDHTVGEYADLDSPIFNSGSFCIRFWYHMFGQHIGKLEVYTVTPTNGNSQLIWSKSREGTNGLNEWRLARVNTTISSAIASTWYLRFRGTRGGDTNAQPFGDIAIDDVILNSCAPTTTTSTTTTTTTTTTTVAPTTKVTSTSTTASTTPSTTASTTTPSTTVTTRGTTQSPDKSSTNQNTQTGGESTTEPISSQSGSTSTSTTTTTPATGNGSNPTVDSLKQELWGLEEKYWIIILSVSAFVILVLLLVIVCQACALNNAKTAHITRRTGDFDNFDGYTKYSGANGSTTRQGSTSAPGYIHAYENGAYGDNP